jgi:hypothetical protein
VFVEKGSNSGGMVLFLVVKLGVYGGGWKVDAIEKFVLCALSR